MMSYLYRIINYSLIVHVYKLFFPMSWMTAFQRFIVILVWLKYSFLLRDRLSVLVQFLDFFDFIVWKFF